MSNTIYVDRCSLETDCLINKGEVQPLTRIERMMFMSKMRSSNSSLTDSSSDMSLQNRSKSNVIDEKIQISHAIESIKPEMAVSNETPITRLSLPNRLKLKIQNAAEPTKTTAEKAIDNIPGQNNEQQEQQTASSLSSLELFKQMRKKLKTQPSAQPSTQLLTLDINVESNPEEELSLSNVDEHG